MIKELIYDPEDCVFYILSNKYNEKLGFFVLRMDEQNPEYKDGSRFLMKVKNKFDIGDTNIFVLRDKKKGIKELIISNKTIYINTYEIKSLDISTGNE